LTLEALRDNLVVARTPQNFGGVGTSPRPPISPPGPISPSSPISAFPWTGSGNQPESPVYPWPSPGGGGAGHPFGQLDWNDPGNSAYWGKPGEGESSPQGEEMRASWREWLDYKGERHVPLPTDTDTSRPLM
jgi:hypothetical protein